MIQIIIFWIANALAILFMAFCPWAAQTIAAQPYMVFPFYIGATAASYVGVTLLMWIVLIGVSLTINKHKEYTKQSRFHGVLFSAMYDSSVWFCGARPVITGMEKVPNPKETRFLFVSNHRSIFDTFIQGMAFWRYPLAFISKPENFNLVFGNRYMTRCEYMAIDRGDVRDGARITKKAADMMKSGDSCVGVYPEGTRNRTEDILLPFKDGCFKSALWARVPIVVGVIHNSAKIHPNFPKPTRVHFEIVDVIPYETIKGMKTTEISDMVRNMMLRALEADYKKIDYTKQETERK